MELRTLVRTVQRRRCHHSTTFELSIPSTTTIRYSVQQPSHVELNIYDSLGQVVKTLVNDFKPNGEYSSSGRGGIVPATRCLPGLIFTGL